MSASDTTQFPEVVVNGTTLPLDDQGRGIYRVRASAIGPKTWGGVINLRGPDGTTKTYNFHSAYSVGEAIPVISATAMNVMYRGIKNPIDVSVPGVSPDRIGIKVVNGTFTREKVKNSKGEPFKGNWAVTPYTNAQNVQLIVSTTEEKGKGGTTYLPYEFRVKPVPPPVAVFAGKNTGSVPKNTAAAQTGVFATQPDFDFDLYYKITSFTVLYTDNRGDFEKTSSSGILTPEQKDLIGRLQRGRNLFIKDIKALAPDGRTLDLNPIILKIE
jgi:gliding motility-associated protein GldM